MNAFDKIIGYSTVKRELMQICDTIRNKEAYEKLGVSAPRGLLLHGEPGVGKSLMASAILAESGRKAFTCRKDRPNGDFVKEIKAIFDQAAQNAPSIVFLDDMDKFANGDERHPDSEEYVTVQSCIDEAKGKEVFVLATANNIRCLPRSLRRAGRFDRVIEIEAPRGKDAEAIIAHYLGSKRFVKNLDTTTIARLLDGKSCAELETIINEAGLYAGYERAEAITMEHFMSAVMSQVFDMPGDEDDDDDDDCDYTDLLSDSSAIYNQIVCHEAGHAVVSEVLCPESVTMVVAKKGGASRGGVTHYYNDLTYTPAYWNQSRIIGSLGGMAAIEQVYGIQDHGACNDLDHAFDEVKDLVGNNCVCGFHLHTPVYGSPSDALKASQEQAIAAEVEKYYRKAKEIIALNRTFFDRLAAALAEKGILTMADVQEIKSHCTVTPVVI